ncbi:Mur ligase family protein, partial [Salmonella enterica subsp. enterica]|uniref:Mur ligase family protein n=1 Tax=Salmonella enterica TaxID=28901 RepID=UPI0030B36E03
MDSLERIVRPDEGIFTSITDEHARGFASLDEKIAEKARLFRHCRKIYYPKDDARIAEALRRAAPEAELVPSDFSADRAVSTRIDVAD